MGDRLPAPVEFLLGPGLSTAAVLKALAPRFDVGRAESGATDRTFMDTFDRRLRGRGLTLERSQTSLLTLYEDGRLVGRASARSPRPDRIFAGDVGIGGVRDRIETVAGERAVLPHGRVHSRLTRTQLRDGHAKIVVRLVFDRPRVVRDSGGTSPLRTRLSVTPVLGYDQQFAGALRLLRGVGGLAVAATSLGAEVVGGPDPATSGPPPAIDGRMRADDATVVLCRHLAASAEVNLDGTVADVDTEFLHDLRVAVRRTRTVLREMKGVLPPAVRARAQDDLRWVQMITGPTRDLDVHLLAWPEATGALGVDAAADLEPLHALLEQKRVAAYRTMRRRLRSARFTDAWDGWRKTLENPLPTDGEPAANAPRPIEAVAGERIRSVYRQMVRAGSVIDEHTDADALHDLRKRGKELRYLLELFGSMWTGPVVQKLVASVKGLQDVLGRFQDCEVEAAYMRSLGPELARGPGGPDALIALGLHLDRLAREQGAARDAFARKFAVFAADRNRRLVRSTFGAPATQPA